MPKKAKRKRRIWRKINIHGHDLSHLLTNNANKNLKTEVNLLQQQHPEQKTNQQLFFIDKHKEITHFMGHKERALKKQLYIDRALNPFPHIKASILPKKRKRDTEKKTQKSKISVKRRKISENVESQKINNNSERKSGTYDIWATEEDPLEKIVQKNPNIEKGYLVQKGKNIKPEKKKKEGNTFPVIEIPKEGTSYNPCFESHQALLKEAVTEQVKKRKELKVILAKLKADYKSTWNMAPEEDPIFLNLNFKDQESDVQEEDEENSQETLPHVFQAHVPQKLKSERNREARRKKNEMEHLKKLEFKERKKQLARIQEILKEIGVDENKSRDRILEKKKIKSKAKVKKLGSEKYQKPEVEVLLSDEIPENLRRMKSEHDPFLERFNNLQKRNIIEVRSRKGFYRRYKLKYTPKQHHKEFEREQEKNYANVDLK